MSNDFSNSQDGILANIMRNQSHDRLAMETRNSERSGSEKGVTLPKREADLDVYAEEPIIWLGYHKTWLGKEVTFNILRTDQPNLITAIYEGGLDNTGFKIFLQMDIVGHTKSKVAVSCFKSRSPEIDSDLDSTRPKRTSSQATEGPETRSQPKDRGRRQTMRPT